MEYCSCSKPLSSLERMNASVACDGDCLPGWTGERCNTSKVVEIARTYISRPVTVAW